MIDWKYGAYMTIWWIILLATYISTKGLTNNFGWSFLALCIAGLIVIVASYFYEREHPQFKDKDRISTVNHLRGIWIVFILVVYLVVELTVPNLSNIAVLIVIALAQIVPAFFTKYTNSKPDKN